MLIIAGKHNGGSPLFPRVKVYFYAVSFYQCIRIGVRQYSFPEIPLEILEKTYNLSFLLLRKMDMKEYPEPNRQLGADSDVG